VLLKLITLALQAYLQSRTDARTMSRADEARLIEWGDILQRMNQLTPTSGKHAAGIDVWSLSGISQHRVYRAGPAHRAL
jgi:hypothetical protein